MWPAGICGLGTQAFCLYEEMYAALRGELSPEGPSCFRETLPPSHRAGRHGQRVPMARTRTRPSSSLTGPCAAIMRPPPVSLLTGPVIGGPVRKRR